MPISLNHKNPTGVSVTPIVFDWLEPLLAQTVSWSWTIMIQEQNLGTTSGETFTAMCRNPKYRERAVLDETGKYSVPVVVVIPSYWYLLSEKSP